ncbi:MAG: CBS domain-containing protein [Saprospiraceae bacterium]|nr:CBS domain-containing protein [Bacteroidia bacterium]NNE16565.1 CBS domain-containing protein [Saprospiraceae bacterium]NNL93762.1 CBS domain-containing protein [Saprospiraceae bacterium]
MNINLNTKIIDIVNKKIRTLHPKDSIEHAQIIFQQTDRKILPVVSNHELKGILFKQTFKAIEKTNKFLIKVNKQLVDISPMRVEDFMTTDVKVLSVRSEIIDALEFFTEHRQYYIPIIDIKTFVGLVTPYDFFKFCINIYEEN